MLGFIAVDYFQLLKAEVIDAGLCTRCGTCIGACPHGALSVPDLLGDCLPQRTDACADCNAECYTGCSGRYVDFPALNHVLHGHQPEHPLIGSYRGLYVAHATDAAVRQGGASGGLATAFLQHLFAQQKIAGAYVMGMDALRPYLPEPRLATTFAEAQTAAQSKYVVRPYNVLFRDIAPEGEPLAYVGVPCQVHSLRKLQQAGHPVARRFRYVIGIYCGNILHFASTRSFLAKQGVHNLAEVQSLAFRAGEWPGNMRVELKSGRVIEMPKFHANYLIPFYIMKRCLQCTDLANEFADVSCGDAWAPVYEERGKGFSMLVVRTGTGQQLFEELCAAGGISAQPLSYDDTVAMHSHGLDLKKRGAFLRIGAGVARGRPVPDYGYRLAPGVPRSRVVMEFCMGIVFRACWTPWGRWLIQWLPDRLVGRLFQWARTRWKGVTRSTKRTGLGTIRFESDAPGGSASADWCKLGLDPLAPVYGSDERPGPPQAPPSA
ncbi:MAG: Coenzyme F420 hydrogenase/dehydrogenase, beta subunit C-terminal domain [Phycisphaerales bacterium]|nr:Coenzyme F420 hydrogenase/dehydrogenase, beta subunit C-terminal domain [Phycisphaerales bacterium]